MASASPPLLNLIAERLQPQSGQVIIGETVRVAYFSQQIDGLDESKRVINFLQEVAEEVKTTVGTTSIADLLEQFLFPRSMHGTLIEKLSGGEKKRLFLFKTLDWKTQCASPRWANQWLGYCYLDGFGKLSSKLWRASCYR